MMGAKNKALLILFVCMALAAIWFAIPSKAPFSAPDTTMPEATRIPEFPTGAAETTRGPEEHEEPQSRKAIARKHGQSARAERLAADYRTLKSIYEKKEAAFRVAAYGDPDEATEAIIDLIENRADVTRESSILFEDWSERRIAFLQRGTYHRSIAVLTYLGLTKTKTAEEFLLDAYKNPHNLIPNQKYEQVRNKLRAMDGTESPDSRFVDGITLRYALTGLLVLDEPKYSLMLEEDFYALVPDAERIHKKENPREPGEDSILLSRFGVLLDLMLIRDVIRRRGTENPEYLLNPNALKGDLTKYWNFQTETVVPRQ